MVNAPQNKMAGKPAQDMGMDSPASLPPDRCSCGARLTAPPDWYLCQCERCGRRYLRDDTHFFLEESR